MTKDTPEVTRDTRGVASTTQCRVWGHFPGTHGDAILQFGLAASRDPASAKGLPYQRPGLPSRAAKKQRAKFDIVGQASRPWLHQATARALVPLEARGSRKGTTMRRRLFTTLVVLTLALGVNVTPVAAHDDTCSSSYFCIWQHGNYDGTDHEHFVGDANDWSFWGIQDDDDSVKNRETVRVRVFTNSGWSGTLYCVLASGEEEDIHSDRDDQGDSNLQGSTNSCSGYPSP